MLRSSVCRRSLIGAAAKGMFEEEAASRRRATQNNDRARADVANMPPLSEPGKTRDKAAALVNVSTRSVERLKEIPKSEGGAKSKMGRPGKSGPRSGHSESRDEAAKMLGVGPQEARALETVFTTPGVPDELKAAVNAGAMSPSRAAKVATLRNGSNQHRRKVDGSIEPSTEKTPTQTANALHVGERTEREYDGGAMAAKKKSAAPKRVPEPTVWPAGPVDGRYTRAASSKAGRAFIASNRDAETAHTLGNHLTTLADLLADPNLAAERREAITATVRRLQSAFMHNVDPDSSARKALAISEAAEWASTALRHMTRVPESYRNRTIGDGVRTMLKSAGLPGDRLTDADAIELGEAWTKAAGKPRKGRRSKADVVHTVAVELGVVSRNSSAGATKKAMADAEKASSQRIRGVT
ncbi:MAG: hypothetical protein U0169_02015 [Polyangiaceae bacterium]